MNNSSSNKDKAINSLSFSEKIIKKYRLLKEKEFFLKNDIIFLYDDQYVQITESSILLKYKKDKDTIAYRIK